MTNSESEKQLDEVTRGPTDFADAIKELGYMKTQYKLQGYSRASHRIHCLDVALMVLRDRRDNHEEKVATIKDETPGRMITSVDDLQLPIHFNVQVHIHPDVSEEQIDHIFASIGKHLASLAGSRR